MLIVVVSIVFVNSELGSFHHLHLWRQDVHQWPAVLEGLQSMVRHEGAPVPYFVLSVNFALLFWWAHDHRDAWKLGQGGAGRGRKWADFRFQSRGACFISSRNFDFQENIYMWSMYWHCAHITNMFRKWLRFYFTSVVCFVKGYHHCSLRGPKW